jgi:hypothetical protein
METSNDEPESIPLLGAWLPAGCERTHARDLFTSRANQPARFLGREKELGIVTKGTVADLVWWVLIRSTTFTTPRRFQESSWPEKSLIVLLPTRC